MDGCTPKNGFKLVSPKSPGGEDVKMSGMKMKLKVRSLVTGLGQDNDSVDSDKKTTY